MNKGMMWGIVVIALLVGAFGGYYYEKTKLTSAMMTMQASMQKQMDNAKMMQSNNTMMQSDKGMMKETAPVMMANDTKLGSIATDANGMTLYTYDKDTKDQSTCSGQCAVIWPPFTVSGTVPPSLPAHLSTFKRADGTMQYAWDGMPLYYFAKDTKAGDTTGDGVGGVWHVAK